MGNNSKQLSNSFSTGGGGGHFEAHVQASFVALMLTGGYAPCLPSWPITEIKLQGKIDGYETDDLVVTVQNADTKETRKLLGQVKHSIRITQSSQTFSEVIQAAWSDFNNPDMFARGKDVIALITGPLSATDTHIVQWLLSQARHTKSADDFYRRVEQAKISPTGSEEKLNVFRHHLRLANNNTDVSNDDLYLFLQDFRWLGYDLGKEDGVVLSLLHSHISQFNPESPKAIWGWIVDTVQTWNQDAGTLTLKELPEELKEKFRQPAIAYIPDELTVAQPEVSLQTIVETSWSQHPSANDLALANIVGAWNEKSAADTSLLANLTRQDFMAWLPVIRDILHVPRSPVALKNGIWKITDRRALWDELGSRIYDQHLETFKTCAVDVLTERDPSFDLPAEERYAANIHGKVLSYSTDLRKGMAEGLALLGCRPSALTSCSQGKAEGTAVLTIRDIFANADWVLWGSLNNLLPILAEAAPNEFLDAVENALQQVPCPFDELFSQEGRGIFGGNYLTGLLWALEGLAWDEKYLVRVCVVLGELASHDPGGQWANRPGNSLAEILLPWLPHTIAPVEKRRVALQTLSKEWPAISWDVILKLLPNQHQISTGTHKPSFRKTIPENWEKGVTHKEYWEQVSSYAEMAVLMADGDIAKLCELAGHFDHLPKPSFDRLLGILSSGEIAGLPEVVRLPLWDKITKFASRHRRYSDAKWALDGELLTAIEMVAKRIAPSDPLNLYQHLFTDRDFDLYEENGDWEEQRRLLDQRRQDAVGEILKSGGLEMVIRFADSVKSPQQVGQALGHLATAEIDTALLPAFLGQQDRKQSQFIDGYVWSRHHLQGWPWVDDLDRSGWDSKQVSQILCLLPFTIEAWDRVSKWLGDCENEYWLRVHANPYQAESKLDIAIDKLLEYGRPHATIDCLARMRFDKQPIDVNKVIAALLNALSSSEPTNSMDSHQIVELIKMLQDDPAVSQDDLFRVEWAYLPLLDTNQEASPKLLENRLASDPEFFCEVIRLMYRSKNEDADDLEPTEEKKAIATNAWRLLDRWRTPPGIQVNGSFDSSIFSDWLRRVKESCAESGHLEVALITLGDALVHSPPDNDGLWINHTIADALNAKDAEDMRRGFRTGIYNLRGVHWVDPTGKPEMELAEQFRQKAEEVEDAGYQRLAVTLRELAKSYERDAQRVAAEHYRDGVIEE